MDGGSTGGDEGHPPDPKPGHWYRDPRALVAFAAAVVGLAIGVTNLARLWDDDPAKVSAAYIVDASRGMAGQIGDKPKLPAVAAEVVGHVKNTPSLSASLRLTGPTCSQGYRAPDVPFDEDNGDPFEEALLQARPVGNSDFAASFSHAASDFISGEDAASSEAKTLYLFVGGADTCSARPVEVVRRALRDLRVNKDIELSLKFVGVKLPPEVREVLKGVRREAKSLGYHAEVVIADTPSELEDALPVPCGPGEDQYEGEDC
jgi:hypothetical protein